jgi:3-hydroxybutyryl-CoA dehydratase
MHRIEPSTPANLFRSTERRITDGDVRRYALLTGDLTRIHVDEEYARTTVFGRCIVHGTLIFAVASAQLPRIEGERGISRLRFHNPVYAGDSVRTVTAVDFNDTGANRRRTATLSVSVFARGDVLVATWTECPVSAGADSGGGLA